MPWDEATRPSHGPGTAAHGPGQADAQHLVDIHDGLRAELAQVRDVLDQVRRGHVTVGAARSVVNTMTMRQNNWTLGAYCESYCRIVTGHHTLEDRSVFPHLRRTEPGLGPVLDRLEHEHEVIHEVLEQFDRALVAPGRRRRHRPRRRAGAGGGAAVGRPAHRHPALAPGLRGARAGRSARPARVRLMSREPDQPHDGDCDAVHRALALLGRAWAGAVLWAMLDGAERFTEVRAAVPGISDAVLTARLRELCDHGLVERQVAPGPPVAVRYLLTDAGRATRPVLEALRDFARSHPATLDGG